MALMFALAPVSSANAADCGITGFSDGSCGRSGISGGSVEVGASITREGSDTASRPGDRNDEGDTGTTPASPGDPQQITDTLGRCLDPVRCGRSGTPALTLTDLASFAPTTPTLRLEPGAFILRNLPANAVTDASETTDDGTLLGHPITVRFTPTTHAWNWGDGTTTTTTTPGRTWNDLDLPRFSPTDTSHVYTDRGSVTVTVTTTVDYRIDGSPWHTVTGTIPTTATTTAYVGTATTVIVPGDCTAEPDAAGC